MINNTIKFNILLLRISMSAKKDKTNMAVHVLTEKTMMKFIPANFTKPKTKSKTDEKVVQKPNKLVQVFHYLICFGGIETVAQKQKYQPQTLTQTLTQTQTQKQIKVPLS